MIANTMTVKHFTIYLLTFSLVAFYSCQDQYRRNNSHKDVSLSSIEKGEELAAKHCQSCHALPDPSLLDSKTWEKGILPQMGPRLGIFDFNYQHYPSYKNDINIGPAFYPSKPALTQEEWQNIIDYYTSISPDSLPGQKRDQA